MWVCSISLMERNYYMIRAIIKCYCFPHKEIVSIHRQHEENQFRKHSWFCLLMRILPNFLQTSLPIMEITKVLAEKGYEVMPSDDAGRFVCNYVYYHSLRFAEQNGIKSLFVHVPLFLAINEETQMKFAASLLEVLASIS